MNDSIIVGVARIVLGLHGNASLKGKRGVLNRIKDRVRDRFNVAIAEVGALDAHERSVMAITCVSNDRNMAEKVLERVIRYIESIGEAELLADDVSVENYGGGFEV